MRKTRTKSGIEIWILNPGEIAPEGEICFLEEEYAHAKKISAGYANDPDTKKIFWEGVFKNKRLKSSYSVFESFPLEEKSSANLAEKYCEEIKAQLRGSGACTKQERENE